MKVSGHDFEACWAAVFGGDWYVDYGVYPEPEDGDDLSANYDIASTWIGWQGKGKPKPNEGISKKNALAAAEQSISFEDVYKTWVRNKTTVRVTAVFELPATPGLVPRLELAAAIKRLGGKIL